MMAVDVADRLEREGHDVSEMRRAIQWGLDNPDEVLNFLPLKDVPFARFDGIRELWRMRLDPPDTLEQAKRQRFENVQVPCFYVCGWFDIIEWASFESFYRMKERGGTPAAREGQHLFIGPWMHGRVLDFLGSAHFGRSGGRNAQVSEQNIAFFDRYLRGREIEIPRVKYFVMGANVWRTAEEWPPPQTTWQRFFLHSQGRANTAGGDGALSRDEPGSEPPDLFVYDPFDPVPTVGGRLIGIGLVPGPLEQYHVERREDVLCYTTSELREDVEVSGPLELHLFAATSARDTDFTARLVDVYPDGRSYNIAEGIIRASGRNLTGERELVNPGEVYQYVIGLGNTSQLFRRGHRIRIDISSSNFPAFDRNMNTGNPIGEDSSGDPATQRIYHRAGAASYIDLPVIPA
jgi:putative CocE/NonD family hydrolase